MGRQKYNYNENYFSKIDTKEKAYWLGFITADGFVMDRKINHGSNGLRIRLNEKDKNHLVKLNESMDSNKPINIVKNYGVYKNSKPLVELSYDSVKIMRDLESLGLKSGEKSGKEEPPTFIDKNLQKYFILGLFDGDGCVCLLEKEHMNFNSFLLKR